MKDNNNDMLLVLRQFENTLVAIGNAVQGLQNSHIEVLKYLINEKNKEEV